MIRTAMVFAAGFGTRMGALTAERPKPLLSVGGRTLLDRALDHLVQSGIGRAVVNLHYRGEMIRKHLAARRDIDLAFSDEAGEILETGGGMRAALPLLGPGPILILNPDSVWTGTDPLATLLSAWTGRGEGLLLLAERGAALGYARAGDFFRDDGGLLTRRGAASEAPFIYSGAGIMDTARLAAEPPGVFSLNRVWDGMIAAGSLAGTIHQGGWVDVGTPEGLALAEKALAS